MDTEGEPPSVDATADSTFKTKRDNVIISLAQAHRSARSSNVVYQEPLETDRGEYYDEWMQKCVAWVAYNHGIKRLDCYSIEFLANFVANEIRRIGRKAAMLSRTRGCDSSNFLDIVTAIECTNPYLYNMIFNEKVVSTAKQLPKQVVALSHSNFIQPAVLAQPSTLYFECMVNASTHLSEVATPGDSMEGGPAGDEIVYNSLSKPNNRLLPINRDDAVMDLDYFIASATRDTYSLKSDEAYQKIVASRPRFAHKHFPLLPAAFKLDDPEPNSLMYAVESNENPNERLLRRNVLLQMELPQLHRVQIQPALQEMRDEAAAAKKKDAMAKAAANASSLEPRST
ncbi:transcription initiation factor TFIID complex subunit TAF8, putative [Babesia ovata]|uniref:Transcription initiation factor TFIID complex subunit TAF8, putative n=1 Tax=Babesia ovata TaxID=189622 RepID=A0A2H6K8Z2_9APIC|nr:transcription initiation factor TFIID complex subunit TAF8, putative [Babesia ovata]GBE59448.1 transcription initiation factor TFIID complex subunit TAF8, putative [Babesia ovata]